MKLLQFIKLLRGLSDADIEKMQAMLNDNSNAETEEDVKADSVEVEEEKQEDNPTEVVDSEESTETAEEEQKKVEEEQSANEVVEPQEEEIENTYAEQDEQLQAEEEEIPPMQKGVQEEREEVVVPAEEGIQDNQEEYKQIIDAQNAKISALEAENATLKNKVEGAFGYSSKVSIPVKTNKLYDDCSDVHIHR